jgi:photosystem II stability/assembly factor-like uncharacterized protein
MLPTPWTHSPGPRPSLMLLIRTICGELRRQVVTLAYAAHATLILYGLVCLSPVAKVAAQSAPAWQLQAPQPTGVTLNAVAMVSATEAWIAGEQGVLLHTTDGGADWSAWEDQLPNEVDEIWWDMSFADNLHGVVAGNVVKYTVNGGKNWLAGTTVAGATFFGVVLVDASFGWGCGPNGLVMRTTNGGAQWSIQSTPTSAFLKDIDFADSERGWAVGTGGTIIATTNGGQNWFLQNSGTTALLDAVSFVSATEGWAGGGSVMLHTSNGGQTWQPQSLPPGTSVFDIDFANAQVGGAAGFQLDIVRTFDGGESWLNEFNGVGNFEAISFGDALHAMAVGTSGTIYYSDDGGASWQSRQNGARDIAVPATGGLSGSPWFGGIFALDSNLAWTAGDVCYTTSGGEVWTPTGEVANDIVFSDASNGWLCKFGGILPMIERSTDGGHTWQPVDDPVVNSGVWASIDTIDGQHVVAVGWDGSSARIISSSDGGESWAITAVDTQTFNYNEVDMVTPLIGYASGSSGRIVKTDDGGATWKSQASGQPLSNLRSVSFADADHGWIAGAIGSGAGDIHGLILRTSNGGQAWEEVTPPQTGGGFWDIDAVGAETVWLSGIGFVGRTLDGGQTWMQETVASTPFEFYDVEFIDAENGWMASSGGGVHGPQRGGVFLRSPQVLVCQADLGFGGPGNAVLSVCGGDLSSGTTADLQLTGAPPLGIAFLVAGLSAAPTPFKGGLLVPVPVLLAPALVVGPDGGVVVPDLPGGGGPLSYYVQAACTAPAQPGVFSLSNALRIDLLP